MTLLRKHSRQNRIIIPVDRPEKVCEGQQFQPLFLGRFSKTLILSDFFEDPLLFGGEFLKKNSFTKHMHKTSLHDVHMHIKHILVISKKF